MPVSRRLVAAVVSPLAAALAVAAVAASAAAPAALAQPTGAERAQAGQAQDRAEGPADVIAAAGELVNGGTGKDLWGRDQAGQRPIASLTKVMTALVVIRAGDLRRRITITSAEVDYAIDNNASNAGLHAGDILSARDLLYGMMLPSGADAAMALAISYGPGIAKFVAKMNALARKLHLTSTRFTNFDGLQSTDVSTPTNLVKLGEAAMAEPAFREVVEHRWFELKAWPHRHYYFWRNTNELLKRYPGTIGIKTGWTPDAGECLLFETTYRKKTVIGVVMDTAPTNSGESFVSAAKLLNWALHRHVAIPPPVPPPASPRFSVGG
jgi:D-alanyl-D-alanine carboxypeptidase (penicillin-binding protein 5/6)